MPVDFPAPGPAIARPAAEPGISGPAEAYRERCRAGLIHEDPAQQRAIARLQQLHEGLSGYRPDNGRAGWLARLARLGQSEAPPRGLYLWGPVGRGKSMLMDLFFASAPVARKRRGPFHAFMLDVHDRIEHERRSMTRGPVGQVAAEPATEATVPWLDQLQVHDH